MAKVPAPTAEESALLKTWAEAVEKTTRRSGPAPEELYLLGSPSAYRLGRLGLPWKTSTMFRYWGDYHVEEAHKRKFLVVERNRKAKVLSIVRHYRYNARTMGKGEENSMTLLHENPSKTNTVPPDGCPVNGARFYRPCLLNEADVKSFAANAQTRMTPIGKKGLCALHSHYQFCHASEIMGGTFQRFLTGPTPEGAIRRAAFTLRKLAEADPKTTPDGEKALLRRLRRELAETAKQILCDFDAALTAQEDETLYDNAQETGNALPEIWLGNVKVAIVGDLAYGPNPRTWAVSLHSGETKTNAEENRESFVDAWTALTK